MKAFPKAPSVSSAPFLLLALSAADSAGSPHFTNTSLPFVFGALVWFSLQGVDTSMIVTAKSRMASIGFTYPQTVDTSTLSSILISTLLPSKSLRALEEAGLMYIPVPTKFVSLQHWLPDI